MMTRFVRLIGLASRLALVAALLFDGTSWAALKVAVISDLNSSYGSTRYEAGVPRAVGRLVALKPDLVIITGDMVAGQRPSPPLRPDAVEAMWAAFHLKVTGPIQAAGIPIAVTPGNHDASAHKKFSQERQIFSEQWLDHLPNVFFLDRKNYPFDYAFSVGEVLFVSLEATRAQALEVGQRIWLDQLLTREGGRFRHRVVFSHLPIYAFSEGFETEVTADRELEQLLQRHRVDLYLTGHHHAFYPGFRGSVRFVGQACLGAGPRKLIGAGQVSERAVTWLEFDGDHLSVTGLAGPQLDRPIDLETLPRSIRSRDGAMIRDDLRPASAHSIATPAVMAPQPWEETQP
jgi:hypothetical protein